MVGSMKHFNTFLETSYKKNMPSKIIEFFKTSKTQKANRVQARSVQRRVGKRSGSFGKYIKPRELKKVQERKILTF